VHVAIVFLISVPDLEIVELLQNDDLFFHVMKNFLSHNFVIAISQFSYQCVESNQIGDKHQDDEQEPLSDYGLTSSGG
jgi:hypothetical protein